jgi:predicted DNA-binding protein
VGYTRIQQCLTMGTKLINMPKEDKVSESLGVRLTSPEKKALVQKSTSEGKSPSQVVRQLIQKYLEEQHEEGVSQRLEALEKQFAELKMQHLGECHASETKIAS